MRTPIDVKLRVKESKLEALWSTSDVAKALGVPLSTVYGWRHRGIGPRGIKVGRHIKFRQSDVALWVEKQADPIASDEPS